MNAVDIYLVVLDDAHGFYQMELKGLKDHFCCFFFTFFLVSLIVNSFDGCLVAWRTDANQI